MANIKFKGNPAHTSGELPKAGEKAPNFKLARNDLSEASLESYPGKFKILNIFPSIDTPTCATSVRKFNIEAAEIQNTVVLNISTDLPFAQKRFCGAEGIVNVETLSAFRSPFGKDYGLIMVDTPLAGLFSRAVVVLSAENKVLYAEQVGEIGSEPNYEAALKTVR
ncbi:MAG: thiol peroxidase [Cryobacterium sp.]|nr:thiol peroxidase [Oligoflexia bacterium]